MSEKDSSTTFYSEDAKLGPYLMSRYSLELLSDFKEYDLPQDDEQQRGQLKSSIE